MFPVHTWLPDAHTEAPTGGSVILAGVMLKLGTYGLLRFGLDLFPEAARWSHPAVPHARGDRHHLRRDRRHDAEGLKRLVAYSSVAHLGLHRARHVRVHDASGHHGGATMQMINHGLSTGALFLLVGYDLRAAPHPPDRRAEGPAEGRPDLRRRLHGRDALVDRACRA
jgi:NADH-quinone oxidoreductase subunit M